MNKRNKHNGFLLTELIVALTVLVIILSCLAMALKVFRNINQYQLTRQRCISAAQAQLDCIAVTGKAIDDEDFKRLWPKMSIEIKQSDGIDQWQGLKLVNVRATVKDINKDITVELARYFAPKGESWK
ncbi:MAG: type II secretion system protein [Phycisphaerae bacterium]|nr:type II secretion system protein [Phycisphaerae bacterium]